MAEYWGSGNLGGGGGGIPIVIYGGLSRPERPKNNSIWIQTETKIEFTTIADTAPQSPAVGDAFIKINTGSTAVSALTKKEEISVKPLSASQWDGASWKTCKAEIYSGNSWKPLINALFYYGYYDPNFLKVYTDKPNCRVDFGDTLDCVVRTSGGSALIVTNEKIDFTGLKTVKIDVESVTGTSGYFVSLMPQNTSFLYKDVVTNSKAYVLITKPGSYLLDVSKVNGKFFLMAGGAQSNVETKKFNYIVLE